MGQENYKVFDEVFKFPYNGNSKEINDEMLSEKFCGWIIKIHKKARN